MGLKDSSEGGKQNFQKKEGGKQRSLSNLAIIAPHAPCFLQSGAKTGYAFSAAPMTFCSNQASAR